MILSKVVSPHNILLLPLVHILLRVKINSNVNILEHSFIDVHVRNSFKVCLCHFIFSSITEYKCIKG